MLGLAIDSADRIASAALWRLAGGDGFALTACDKLPPETGKPDQLITVVERLLGEQGLDYGDLGVIAVNRGPGSFTGIRSAVALARGLALSASLQVIGVTSHEALAAMLSTDEERRSTLIALDARRGEVYAQAFGPGGEALGEIEAHSPACAAANLGVGRWRLAGSGSCLVASALSGGGNVLPIETPPVDACAVALAAARRLSTGDAAVSGFELRPLYVRAPDAVPPAPLIGKALPPAAKEAIV